MGMAVAVGTEKGAFLLRSADTRVDWDLTGPFFEGWKVTAFGEAGDGSYLLATASNWFGAALHRSTDLDRWVQIVAGPAWPKGGDRRLNQIWTLSRVGSDLLAGVDEAGIFRSADRGETWQPVEGLNEHHTRPAWQPGLGGLAAHRVVADHSNHHRLWVAISAVGVFRSDDGGATWHPKNQGVERALEVEEFDDIGFCVHCIVQDPDDADVLYRQEHRGVFRTRDGGDSWERIEEGLPAGFGFPIVQSNGSLFVVPLESDENRLPVDGRFRVYRSIDRGDSWSVSGTGHPQAATYTGVLRGAMDADQETPGGIYLGTTAGTIHCSNDGGDTWITLPWTLPRILSVRAFRT